MKVKNKYECGNLSERTLLLNLFLINVFPILIISVFFVLTDNLNLFKYQGIIIFEDFFFTYVPIFLVVINFIYSLFVKDYDFYLNIIYMLVVSFLEILIYLINALFIQEKTIEPPLEDKSLGLFIVYTFIRFFHILIYSMIAKIILFCIKKYNQKNEGVN